MKFIVRAISYFKPELPLITALLVLIGASVLLGLLSAWPMAILVDTVLSQSPHPTEFHRLFLAPFGTERIAQVIGVTVAGMCIKILGDLVMLGRVMLNNRIRLNGTSRVKNELYGKLQTLGLGWHRQRSQGDTIYRLSYDTNGPWGVLDTLIGSGAASVSLAAMTVIMLYRSVWLTAFALAITPLLAIVNHVFTRSIRKRATAAKRAEAEYTVVTQRAMSLIGLIQTFGRQASEARRFEGSVERTVDVGMRLAWQENLYPFSVQFVFALGGAVIFGFGGWLVYRDQFLHPVPNGVTCGDLMVFMAYLGQLWDPLGWVLGFPTKIQTHSAACERVFEVLDEPPAVLDSAGARSLSPQPRTISLSKLSFEYTRGAPLLSDLHVTIKPGEMVAFIGPSGAGKSTILNLLPRFYDATSGAVMLDGHDVRDLKLSDVRRHMAIVSQESPLFPGTIAENLRYGREDATGDEIRAAAIEAGAADFIEELPDGYDTVITEGGQNLSGGQRQRLAIARALVSKAPILILDEPTSALDPVHEQWVMETLNKLRRSRTIILVTHRIESVRECDQVFVLDQGTIAERGTHRHLIGLGGRYARMIEQSASGGVSRLRDVA